MPTKAIPDGYHTVTPYLVMRDAARAIDRRLVVAEPVTVTVGDAAARLGDQELGRAGVATAERIDLQGRAGGRAEPD